MSQELDMKKLELLSMARCWGIAELQRRAGLSGTTVYKIRNRQQKASMKTIGKLALALGCDPQDLLKA